MKCGFVQSRSESNGREYLRAAKRHKTRICFVDKSAGDTDPRQAAFISRVNEDDMIAKCASWGAPAPEWYEDDVDDFRVVLKRPVSETNTEKTMVKTRVETRVKTGVKSSVESSVKKLSSAKKIMTYLAANPTATAHELSIVVNLTVKGVEWNLKVLTGTGRLRHVGPTKGGHWEVIG